MTTGDPSGDPHQGVRRGPFDIPARVAAGIWEVSLEAGRAVQTMSVPDWMRDETGAVVPGGLGIIADSALGTAVMSTVAAGTSMVTSHLHLEVLAPIPDSTTEITVESRRRSLVDRFGIGEGDARTETGLEVARATIGSVLLTGRPLFTRPAQPRLPTLDSQARSPRRPHRLIRRSPVHQHLRTEVISARRSGVTIRVPADPQLANSGGGLHGGVGVLLGERVLDLALSVALTAAGRPPESDTATMRLVELRAAFVRGIPADGEAITCHGTIIHAGRRLAAARGEVRTQEGRVAVLIDATYVGA